MMHLGILYAAETVEELQDDRSDEEIMLAKKKANAHKKNQKTIKKKIKKKYIYQWQDEKGNTVISDRPHKGAIAIEIPRTQTFRAPKPVNKVISSDNVAEVPINNEDKSPPGINIISPVNDAWLQNNNGNVSIQIGLDPYLGRGQELLIQLDGVVKNKNNATSLSLENLPRGEHHIDAIIRLKSSKKILAKESVVFYVKRPIIKRKK